GTDYAGGYWDSILLGIQHMVADDIIDLPKAIAMASRNVARAIPRVGERGELVPGKIADVVIAPLEQLSNVHTVIVGGRLAYEDGKVLFGETAQA
ncbi:MAG: amidohydrolase, partial [Chloroflexota bacterium]|nr:amidohydrolase [Chloroflexota bacterium]